MIDLEAALLVILCLYLRWDFFVLGKRVHWNMQQEHVAERGQFVAKK